MACYVKLSIDSFSKMESKILKRQFQSEQSLTAVVRKFKEKSSYKIYLP